MATASPFLSVEPVLAMKYLKWGMNKNPVCLGYIGDKFLSSYVGIVINHCKDPVIKPSVFHGK